MSISTFDRRDFLKSTSLAAAASLPWWFSTRSASASLFKAPSERPVIGCIGTGSRWDAVGPDAMKFGDCVAVCDVDKNHADKAKARCGSVQSKKGSDRGVEVYEDYRKLLDRRDIELVTIVTPDHWHSKIAIDALKAGKDVYCEKPLTLTIDEGKQILKVLNSTKRVFQVGTQQRSEMHLYFLKAVALVRGGRIGKVKRVKCAIGGAPKSGPLETAKVPSSLNWNLWLGQAPQVDYIPRRCHYEFRWWYEYSGGKMTDWGAHHIDIAQWAIGMENSGPLSVDGTAKHPVPFKDGFPTVANEYNTAMEFLVQCQFPNGVELLIRHGEDKENGITFEGEKGTLFVSRGKLTGDAVTELQSNPLPEDALTKLYKGKEPGSHMRNFFECVKTREQPISDVATHHRAMTTCHLANISIRLGRKLTWDPKTEQILGDDAANAMQTREQRKGNQVVA